MFRPIGLTTYPSNSAVSTKQKPFGSLVDKIIRSAWQVMGRVSFAAAAAAAAAERDLPRNSTATYRNELVVFNADYVADFDLVPRLAN